MAGSWNHAVDDDGALLEPEDLAGMLENGGDVWEFAEQAYGMVWLLAHTISTTVEPDPEDIIDMARENYKYGLKLAEQQLKEKNE